MARGIYLVVTRPVSPEREPEYNEWYDKVHIPDCLKVPGWAGATRYRRAPSPADGTAADPFGGRQYLTIYDFDAPDLQDPINAVRAVSAQGAISLSGALEMDPRPYTILYERL
jgi:hypothetical protein